MYQKRRSKKKMKQMVIAVAVGIACIIGCGNADMVEAEVATGGDAGIELEPEAEPSPELATIGDATYTNALKNNPEGKYTNPEAVETENTPTETEAGNFTLNTANQVATMEVAAATTSSKKYEGEYKIDYILSHYSYFVEENLEGDYVSDTVGAVIVGNKLNLKNTVGKVKAAASYAKYLMELADYPINSWNETSGIDTNFYYTKSFMTYKEWLTNRMVQVEDDYIDIQTAFSEIKQEAKQLEASGTAAYLDESTLIVDFSDSKNKTISGADYAKASRICLKNVTAEDILSDSYTISISGTSDYTLDTSKIEINGTSLNNNYFFNLVKNKSGSMEGGQYYNGKFGLIWNFPDAENVTANFLTGHLVAPSGNVTLQGGNHEGQVIAKNIKSHSESHFYPYNITTEVTTEGTTEATTEGTTEVTTETTTEATTEVTTEATTEVTTEGTTEVTTEGTTELTTEATTEGTTEATTEGTTELTTEATTEGTTELTTRETLVTPKVAAASVETNTGEEVKTGDTMALGIVITLLIASASGLLLFAVLNEHKK